MLEIICVPVIVAVVYGIIELYKKFIAKDKEFLVAIVPLISAILGGLLGILAFYLVPSIIVATNVVTAFLVGLCSGLSATGTNQIFKQFKKLGIEVKETEVKTNSKTNGGDANDKSN